MNYVYYSTSEATIYLLDHRVEDHGVLLGTISQLPAQPAFLVQSLLVNAGYEDVSGLTFSYEERPSDTSDESSQE